MKFISALVVMSVAAAAPRDHYSVDVSALNMEEFLKDPAKMKAYSDCLLDLGESHALGAAVKKALATGYVKCTPAQRQVISRIILNGRQQLPDETELLIKKYYLQGQYNDAIEKFLASTD